MVQKQTPRSFQLPVLFGELKEAWNTLTVELRNLVNSVRNDLDNGSTSFTMESIAGIANVDIVDFEDGQMRLYKDTSDADKVYEVIRYDTTLYRSAAMTAL